MFSQLRIQDRNKKSKTYISFQISSGFLKTVLYLVKFKKLMCVLREEGSIPLNQMDKYFFSQKLISLFANKLSSTSSSGNAVNTGTVTFLIIKTIAFTQSENLLIITVPYQYHTTIHVLFAKTWLLQADARDCQKGAEKKGEKAAKRHNAC